MEICYNRSETLYLKQFNLKEKDFENLPVGLDVSCDFVDQHENLDKTIAQLLGYSTTQDVFRDATVIEIIK